jgi:signal transduction histidine kinase
MHAGGYNGEPAEFRLGLAIVKQALEAHGGRVSVRNAPGKGCVFSLELPDARDGN